MGLNKRDVLGLIRWNVLGLNRRNVLGLTKRNVLGLNKGSVLGLKRRSVSGLNKSGVLGLNKSNVLGLNESNLLLLNTTQLSQVSVLHSSGTRSWSPWVTTGSYSARMKRTASRYLFKPLPDLQEHFFRQKKSKLKKLSKQCLVYINSRYTALGGLYVKPLSGHSSQKL